MKQYVEELKELEIVNSVKTSGLFKVDHGVKEQQAWIDVREGLDYYVYDKQSNLVHDPKMPAEISKIFKKKKGEGNAKLENFTDRGLDKQ